jgi:hypothetical protein
VNIDIVVPQFRTATGDPIDCWSQSRRGQKTALPPQLHYCFVFVGFNYIHEYECTGKAVQVRHDTIF